jgi:hypothetical protein
MKITNYGNEYKNKRKNQKRENLSVSMDSGMLAKLAASMVADILPAPAPPACIPAVAGGALSVLTGLSTLRSESESSLRGSAARARVEEDKSAREEGVNVVGWAASWVGGCVRCFSFPKVCEMVH